VDASKIEIFYFPMNNNKTLLDNKYIELEEKIINLMNNNTTVAYVTIGDSTIYSTFNYLWLKLKQYNIDVEFIPGIPSFIAAANILYLPLVIKNENFCIIEMPEDKETLLKYIMDFNTVIIMKIYKKLHILLDFIECNKNMIKTAILVERATLEGQRIVELLENNERLDGYSYMSTAIIKTWYNGKA
jgi:precorrin-2/cobalt-factor-2 C20-methyltransferase